MFKISSIALMIFLLITTLPQNAFCYIDPGTGSFLIQFLAAFFIGVLFALKKFWGKIKAFFSNLFGNKQDIKEP
jgi:hypothetical protein